MKIQQPIDNVLFIYSAQPLIDRGWDTVDVKSFLQTIGFKTHDIFIYNEDDGMKQLSNHKDNVLVWPVCYTIGAEFNNRLLIDLLHELNIPYISPSVHALKFNSKLMLKQGLSNNSLIKTPCYQVINSQNIDRVEFSTPYLMKCEYSCNSEGVVTVNNQKNAKQVWNQLINQFKQVVFAEEYERVREFTVSYIPGDPEPIIAPIEVTINSDSLIIDSLIKNNNKLLSFSLPDISSRNYLIDYVNKLANHLSIDSHFRVDILKNNDGIYHVIDLNLLPQMHFSDNCVSYFPISLKINFGFNREDILSRILMAVKHKFKLCFTDNIETTINTILRK